MGMQRFVLGGPRRSICLEEKIYGDTSTSVCLEVVEQVFFRLHEMQLVYICNLV